MGRQLAEYRITNGTETQEDDTVYSYTYNEEGIRTSKTVNGVKTTYYLDGTNIIEQRTGDTVLHFHYDSNDEIIGFTYGENDYFYVKNSMGDITGITDINGNLVASYTYDAWGKVLDEELTAIGELNPFRYRGYYYDSDIQMYYLQSRYYDPEVGRFINSDDVNFIGATGSEISYNPFAYCENNPVNDSDPSGTISILTLRNRLIKKLNDFKSWVTQKKTALYEILKQYFRLIVYDRNKKTLGISASIAAIVIDSFVYTTSKPTAISIKVFGTAFKVYTLTYAKKNVENFFKKQIVPFLINGVVNKLLTKLRYMFWYAMTKIVDVSIDYTLGFLADKAFGKYNFVKIALIFSSLGSLITALMDDMDGCDDGMITFGGRKLCKK